MKRTFMSMLLLLLVNVAVMGQSLIGSWIANQDELKEAFGEIPVVEVKTFNQDNTFTTVYTVPMTMNLGFANVTVKFEVTSRGKYKADNEGNIKLKVKSTEFTKYDMEFPGLTGEQEAELREEFKKIFTKEYFQQIMDKMAPQMDKRGSGDSRYSINGNTLLLGYGHYVRILKGN